MSEPYSRPLNLGHRGARALAPENTLAGMAAAVAAGADGVEFDVQRTADGHLVLFHDEDLRRIAGVAGRITDSTLAQLRELDAGSHFGPQFTGQGIPTLDETIETLPAGFFLNIEAKRTPYHNDGLEAAVAAAVQHHNLYERCLVSSFNVAVLWRLARLDRRIPLGLLYAPDMLPGLSWGWPRHVLRLTALNPYHEQVTPALVRKTHARGQQVNTWTVNEVEEMQRLIGLGVNAIITDRPDLLHAVQTGVL